MSIAGPRLHVVEEHEHGGEPYRQHDRHRDREPHAHAQEQARRRDAHCGHGFLGDGAGAHCLHDVRQRRPGDGSHGNEHQEVPEQRDAAERDQVPGILEKAAREIAQPQRFALFQRLRAVRQAGEEIRRYQNDEQPEVGHRQQHAAANEEQRNQH
jgi:hypothetical protein